MQAVSPLCMDSPGRDTSGECSHVRRVRRLSCREELDTLTYPLEVVPASAYNDRRTSFERGPGFIVISPVLAFFRAQPLVQREPMDHKPSRRHEKMTTPKVRSEKAICGGAFDLLRQMATDKLVLREMYHPSQKKVGFVLGPKVKGPVDWRGFVAPEAVQVEVARYALQWPGVSEYESRKYEVSRAPTYQSWSDWLKEDSK